MRAVKRKNRPLVPPKQKNDQEDRERDAEQPQEAIASETPGLFRQVLHLFHTQDSFPCTPTAACESFKGETLCLILVAWVGKAGSAAPIPRAASPAFCCQGCRA